MFKEAHDSGMSPPQFVEHCKKTNKLIMGIGHRIKSLANPDQRVVIIKEFAKKHFSSNAILDFALGVEQLTTRKRANLILNVDGCIAVCFVDMLRSCGAFANDEVEDLLSFGTLNGLFVLGRSCGFIAHYLDQLRLKQPLYRHPWDDITYINAPSGESSAEAPKFSAAASGATGSTPTASGTAPAAGARPGSAVCASGPCRVVANNCIVA